MYDMTGWNQNVSEATIALTGFIQGAGPGFLFVLLTTVTFSTLPEKKRVDCDGAVQFVAQRGLKRWNIDRVLSFDPKRQINHATISAHVTATNRAFDNAAVLHAWSPWTPAGRVALDQLVQTQASIISYIDDFKLMMVLSLAAIPLVLLLRRGGSSAPSDHAMVMERLQVTVGSKM